MEEREGGEPFFLQTPVTRSKRLAGGWAVRAPFPSGLALHPEVRFAWELGWLPFMQSPFGPKVYPKEKGGTSPSRLHPATSSVFLQASLPPRQRHS